MAETWYRVSLRRIRSKAFSLREIIEPVIVIKETDKCVFYGKGNKENKSTLDTQVVKSRKDALKLAKDTAMELIADHQEKIETLKAKIVQFEKELAKCE